MLVEVYWTFKCLNNFYNNGSIHIKIWILLLKFLVIMHDDSEVYWIILEGGKYKIN